MMNLFDLSTGMAGSKKAFGDGSIGYRNRLVVASKTVDPVEIHLVDRPFTCESMKGSGKKPCTKPVKVLIAQEMSKEIDSKRKSPNVVARLMGLDDALPGDLLVQSAQNNLQDGGSGKIHAEVKIQSCCNENKDYRDVYEISRRPSRSNSFNDRVLQKGQYNEDLNEKRMALVREKFMEAKRLATDEKLLESKEFHDALEVLSSNRDLFLKFLEEPNSLFSSHLEEHSIRLPPQTKHITLLRPSKTNEMNSKVKQHQCTAASDMQSTIWCSSFNHRPMTEKLSQPTRIVVLKPSPRKHFDTKSPTLPSNFSPEPSVRRDCYDGLNTQGSKGSMEAEKDINLPMCESLSMHRRDESLLSSVFSNGYVGDDSSFNRSDNYVGEDCNNTDSEIASSWDYISNRYESPCSHSSLSRASCSPESSVIREAKKRLSERWTLVTSNELYKEKIQGRRSSSTLGEMLTKMEIRNDMEPGAPDVRSQGWKEDFKVPAACFSIGRIKDENRDDGSAGNLSRSKSVPTSSLTYGSIDFCSEDSESLLEKSVVTKEAAKCRSGKTSFKGIVSSFFSLKNKKESGHESVSSPFDGRQIGSADIVVHKHHDSSQAIQTHVPKASPSWDFEANSGLTSSPVAFKIDSDESKTSAKISLPHEEQGHSSENQETLTITEKPNENQDHPSPTSTLDAPFKDDASENTPNSSKLSGSGNPQALTRSPPIETISRTLSWDDSCSKAALSTTPLKLSTPFCKAGEDDPEDLMLVQNLMTASGLCKNSLSTIFNGWHSPDIPLDPKLLDKLSIADDKVGKTRTRRSNQRLIFDWVNVVVREIACSAEHGAFQSVPENEISLAGQVWPIVRKKLDVIENGGLAVEGLLGREVTGIGWTELVQAEVAAISNEIGVQVLDDLFGEALVELNAS